MKKSTAALGLSSAVNMSEINKILHHIDTHPEKQGELAKRDYKRTILITLSAIAVMIVVNVLLLGSIFKVPKKNILKVQLKRFQDISADTKRPFGTQTVAKNIPLTLMITTLTIHTRRGK